MEKGMMSEYFSDDGKRRATIRCSYDTHIVKLYESDDMEKMFMDNSHDVNYWEDCCENWVNYWGEFKK
jgi:hypothetical protein